MTSFTLSASLVRTTPILRRLSAEEWGELASAAIPRDFEKGRPVFVVGDAAPEVLLVLEGEVGVAIENAPEEERLAARGPGDWVGEGALFADGTRSATVIAESAVRTLAIPRERFLTVVTPNRDAVIDLLRMLRQRLLESDAARISGLRRRVANLSSANEELSQKNQELREELDGRPDFAVFVGSSAPARAVREISRQAAHSEVPILLIGETGTGKEILARAIHAASPRAAGRFVAVNCGLLRDSLLESELFGHARGAFTGATQAKPGLVELASAGTLLLDEIGDMPSSVQAGLLRFLELGEFRRLGETQPRHSDVRVIAATHRSLDAEVEAGAFRADLLFRLDVIRISIPAVRERMDDLPLLIAHCVQRTAERLGVPPLTLTVEAQRALVRHDFPGNVRELENEIERLYAMRGSATRVRAADLSDRFRAAPAPEGTRYSGAVRQFRKQLLERALREAGGNRTHAAARLGLHRSNLVRMIRDLEIS